MSTATDQFTEFTARTQEAVTSAARTWANTVQPRTGGFTDAPALPDAQAVVDRYFDVVQQVLDTQRRVAQTLVAAGTQATEAVTEQAARAAQSVTDPTVNATDVATTKVADAAKAAGQQ